MKDIISLVDGFDIGFADTVVTRAGNVLSVQKGSLEYAPDFGVDFKFFLDETLLFQNESFKAYLVERLTQHQINVSSLSEVQGVLSSTYTVFVGDSTSDRKGLIG